MKHKFGQKLYSPLEAYRSLYYGLRGFSRFKKAKKNGTLEVQFKERIMLAVTEVNGCPVCAYGHTQAALESGMSAKEIDTMLGGEMAHVPEYELPAVLFAQHYADTRGKPTKEAWERIVALYGEQLSNSILSAIRIITVGNTYGIPFGSFRNRFKKNKEVNSDKRSNIAYELIMLISVIPFLLIAFIHATVTKVLHKPLIQFR